MITTILHRPYVFVFLIAFLVLARLHWQGWKKPFLWLVIGYVVAFLSELSSIHNGFPYGLYHYIYENMPGEVMVAGVPLWDSLSYPFLIFAGYATAEFILTSTRQQVITSTSHRLADVSTCRRADLKTAVLGATLTMLLDIIIDPLTNMGEKWFLGKIYYYPNGGEYFGVPLTNFAGWFLVPLVVIILFQMIVRHNPPSPPLKKGGKGGFPHFLNPLFYLSIAIFNIAVTISIGEALLASIDCFLLVPVVGVIAYKVKKLATI